LHLDPIIIGISLLQGRSANNRAPSLERSSGELTEAADELLEWLTLGAELGTIKKWRKGEREEATWPPPPILR
jgi:hypothetical protein